MGHFCQVCKFYTISLHTKTDLFHIVHLTHNIYIIYLLEAGYSSTVTTSMPFHAATLTPQNRHCRAMIADWLKLRNSKKVQPAEMSMDPPEEIHTDTTMNPVSHFNILSRL